MGANVWLLDPSRGQLGYFVDLVGTFRLVALIDFTLSQRDEILPVSAFFVDGEKVGYGVGVIWIQVKNYFKRIDGLSLV